MDIVGSVRDFLLRTTRHPLGFIGVNLTTLAGVLLVILLLSSLFGVEPNPYLGMVTFLILPGLFLFGLLMIPIGSWLHRRRLKRLGPEAAAFPVYDLNQPSVRNRLILIAVLTLVNVSLLSAAAYKGIEHMDSVEFCGQTCHPVMKPEYTVYENSPHSRVRCVDCHIGPGASWFVKSKLSGTRQVLNQIAGTYQKPIETPVHNLRPSRDTCEQCHWPEKFHGDRVWVKTHYQEDEANTPLKTVLLMKIGGGNPESEFPRGIHWHILNKVYYRSDAEREVIPWIRVERLDGTVTEYRKGEMPDSIAEREVRLMDCVDCHNRPTHIYKMPGPAIDEAMWANELPTDLPYLRREAFAAITADYPDNETAMREIAAHIRGFYEKEHPEVARAREGEIDSAVAELQTMWDTYVYPEMNIDWGTYPDHIGHVHFEGCFRCHDEEHEAEDGSTISQDCETCHSILAWDEEDPEILETLFP
ncbi:MAG: cytochrome C [Candidatus Eisenbacteria bacterium]|nr:cytochrome C [Candidatus Latescibacterota bacterium]MBD3301428.1 cytochrome C [Candidatus Eisenbacteria bacterium]